MTPYRGSRVYRLPAYFITLALMLVSAAIVLFVVILPLLAWLFAMGSYIQSAT